MTVRGDVIGGDFLFLVGYVADGDGFVGYGVRSTALADNGSHFSGFSFKGGLTGFDAQHLGFLDVGGAGDMGGASLHQVQFNRTDFAANFITHEIFQNFCRTGDVAVAEVVYGRGLYLLRDIASLFVLDSFADCHYHTVAVFQFLFHIFDKTVVIKICFTQIDQIRTFSTA